MKRVSDVRFVVAGEVKFHCLDPHGASFEKCILLRQVTAAV